MKVIINSWTGDRFLNDNRCTICLGKSTTINITDNIKVCKGCLNNAIRELDEVVLESKTYRD